MSAERPLTVFVTGGSSRIGQAVVARLGPGVRGIFLAHARPVPAAGGPARTLDGGLEAVARHAEAVRSADVVLHMAGVSHAKRDEVYTTVNEQGTRRLVEVCRPAQPIVYLSTRCVGPDAGAYGRSKARAEEAIAASGRPYVIVRPSEVYGTNAGEGIDALIRIAERWRVLVDFRWQPEVRYSPVSCDELARFVAGVVRGDLAGASKVYTICNNRSYTARDIQAALERRLGAVARLPVSVRLLTRLQALGAPVPFAPDQLERLVAGKPDDNAAARRDYGFSPRCFLDYLQDRSPSSGG